MIKLLKPIIFFDLETTGVDVTKDKICQIAIVKVNIDGSRKEFKKLINPGIEIPISATDVHGITNEMVANEPIFNSYSKSILELLEGCDIGGFNSNKFDVPLLYNELERCKCNWDISNVCLIDAGNIYKIQEPRTLTAAYKFYTGKELDGAHDALNDVRATIEVFIEQTKRYENLPETVGELDVFSNFGKVRVDIGGVFSINDSGNYIFNLGKHKNEVVEIKKHSNYLEWMMKSDFNGDTKRICSMLLNKMF